LPHDVAYVERRFDAEQPRQFDRRTEAGEDRQTIPVVLLELRPVHLLPAARAHPVLTKRILCHLASSPLI